MGTRADFYVKKNRQLKQGDWIRSIAWDGYPEGIPDAIKKATTEEQFLKEFRKFINDRNDFSSTIDGWPWPWDDTGTTDYGYVFTGKKLVWNRHKWPNMKSIQKVDLGQRSGLLIINTK